MNAFKKFVSFIIGLLLVIILFELFLRFFPFEQRQIIQDLKSGNTFIDNHEIKNKKFNLLVLGNSHTAGAGVNKEDAYAGVLQRFFDSHGAESNYKVTVVNGGLLNANTYDIYNNIDFLVEKYKPHLALIMAGEPNVWNKSGYSEFVNSKNYKEQNTFMSNLVYLSNYSRALKWILSFNNLTTKVKLTEIQQDD